MGVAEVDGIVDRVMLLLEISTPVWNLSVISLLSILNLLLFLNLLQKSILQVVSLSCLLLFHVQQSALLPLVLPVYAALIQAIDVMHSLRTMRNLEGRVVG